MDLLTAKSRLNFFYLNARSICSKGKFDELKVVIRSIPATVHIILIAETWIKNEDQVQQLQLQNYTHYHSYRTDKIGGGVSIYAHNDLNHSLVESIYSGGNNYLWIKLENYALDIGVVYYPGDTDFDTFVDALDMQLQQRNRSLVFGDFNINLLEGNRKRAVYKNTLKEAGYTILNKINKDYFTRETATKKSILDHVSTNLKNDHFHLALCDSPMSDHRQIYLSIRKQKPPQIKRIAYTALNYENLYASVKEQKLEFVDRSFSELEEIIKINIESSKLTKFKIQNPPLKDWINKDILNAISRRNQLWMEHRKDPKNATLANTYLHVRNEVTAAIKNTKDSYYYKKFSDCKNNPKKTWSLINNLSSLKVKSNCAPLKLTTETDSSSDLKGICNIFNHYFSTIGARLAEKIPLHSNNTNQNNQLQSNSNNALELTSFKPCTTDEVIKIINNLDHNSSTGLDGVSAKAIKCIKNLIADRLSGCLNVLLSEGHFPNSLKLAKVSPIYKSGVKTDPGNYRPISVLPILSKILEKILFERLETHLNSINFITDRQFGFRPKSNTLAATLDLITKIQHNIDRKNIVLGVFIDLKKAFDTVSHKLLLEKLTTIGIRDVALEMFSSYLKDRQQVVKIDGYQSRALPIHCGVPQGSILGPLLFLIYINNVDKIGLNGHITLYADDTCLFYFGTSMNNIISQAQQDLDTLTAWLQQNLLTINASKTSFIIFKAKNKPIPPFNSLKIHNIPIQEKKHEKYLGLHLDSQLTWKPHIDHIKKKISSLMGSLRPIVRCIPRKARYNIYNSLVKSHLIYLIEIWGNAGKTKISELQVIQNKIIKLLFHYPYRTPTARIYKETHIMNIKQLFNYHTCLLTRKVLHNTIHTSITLTQSQQVTQRSRRRASYLVLPKTRTNYGKRMFHYKGAQMFNKLPSSIKGIDSLDVFKKKLAQYVVEVVE